MPRLTPIPTAAGADLAVLAERVDRLERDVQELHKYAHDNIHDINDDLHACVAREEHAALVKIVADIKSDVDRAIGAFAIARWLTPILTAVTTAGVVALFQYFTHH